MFTLIGCVFVALAFGIIVGFVCGVRIGEESERDRQRFARRLERGDR